MSGGHFDYAQYRINDIVDQIERIIKQNPYEYPEEIIDEFKNGIQALNLASEYAQRIDWLISGDDGEESFLRQLRENLTLILEKHENCRKSEE